MSRKKVLSVEAQIVELRKFAMDNNLKIAGIIIEKKSAKTLGRPKFNKMLQTHRKWRGKRYFVVAPRPLGSELGRRRTNYLLARPNALASARFPTFWFENTSEGFMFLWLSASRSIM